MLKNKPPHIPYNLCIIISYYVLTRRTLGSGVCTFFREVLSAYMFVNVIIVYKMRARDIL